LSDAPEIDEPKSILNRQNDTLQKIMGNNHVFNPDKVQGSLDTLSTRPPTTKKPESISLAAFMGGRASGPRLNRHAPQQDAHDPTQFDLPDTRAPHPIFGKGGVAMPGMVAKSGTRESTPSASSGEDSERYRQSRGSSASTMSSTAQRYAKKVNKPSFSEGESHRSPETIITPTATRSVEKEVSKSPRDKHPTAKLYEKGQREPEQHAISGQNAGIWERTTSTPSIVAPADNLGESPIVNARPSGSDAFSRTLNPLPTKSTPMRDRTISTPSYMANERQPVISKEPRQILISPSLRPSTVTPPSLARPILPEARLPSQTPVIPATPVASPAFRRSQLQKDPSPSISRLQGRGFVQNMVKASIQLEQQSGPSPSDKSRPANGGRKSSVLDRWQPGTQPNSSPISPPMASPSHRQDAFHASSVRRSTTTDLKDFPTELQHMKKPVPAPTSLKSVASLPSLLKSGPTTPVEPLTPRTKELIKKMPPEGDLGSATTMFVVKPGKSSPRLPAVDELGVKHAVVPAFGNRKGQFRASLQTAASSGKPLIHVR
jgi:hypothetical protein